MPNKRLKLGWILLTVLCGARSFGAIPPIPPIPPPRVPLGIYAYVVVEEVLNGLLLPAFARNDYCSTVPTTDPGTCFTTLFNQLVSNKAVSGLALEVNWKTLNPTLPSGKLPPPLDCSKPHHDGDPAYDWSTLDAAFCAVENWNQANPGHQPETIQLMVTPGFGTPQWALDQLPVSCDALFNGSSPSGPCNQVTFYNDEGWLYEPRQLQPLPLPWDPTYQSLWSNFLQALNARYGANPAFVSIAVDGPSGTTYEMIVPYDTIPAGATGPGGAPAPYPIPAGGLSQVDMWATILSSQSSVLQSLYPKDKSSFVDSDEAFIRTWEDATDTFQSIFSNVTLVGNYGGLINFSVPPGAPTAMTDVICPGSAPDLACTANGRIFDHLTPSCSGAGCNAVASQYSGVAADQPFVTFLNLDAVKALSTGGAPAGGQVFGGGQANVTVAGYDFSTGALLFDTSFPGPLVEGCAISSLPPACSACVTGGYFAAGCTGGCIPAQCLAAGITLTTAQKSAPAYELPTSALLSPEQGFYYVLQNFFHGTAAAPYYGYGADVAPLNYLQLYYEDILYASQSTAVVPVTVANGTGGATKVISTTAQEILNKASLQLWQQTSMVPPGPPPPQPPPNKCDPGDWCQF